MRLANSATISELSFRYDESDAGMVLEGISIAVEAGKVVAIIGPSGSGKTTLGLLIVGLLRPTKGSSTIDGVDAHEFAISNPGRLAYLSQRTHIIEGSLVENIALGVPLDEVDYGRFEAALAISQLDSLRASFTDGEGHKISSSTLSGGQIQRIGLARALYSQPSFLLLDEPTSALDADTEFAVTEALKKLAGSCTVVVIAHRLVTIQGADNIIVLEKGKVTASGKFETLQRESKLVERQAELLGMAGAVSYEGGTSACA